MRGRRIFADPGKWMKTYWKLDNQKAHIRTMTSLPAQLRLLKADDWVVA